MGGRNKFQSLIGRLKTDEGNQWHVFGATFQSLIGRLKTLNDKLLHNLSFLFQSLIGRLKTLIKLFFGRFVNRVSIPYR